MKRAFQTSFEPSHYHTIRHTGDTLPSEEEDTIAAAGLPSCQTTECDEIRLVMLKALNRVLLLTRVC